MPRRPTRGYKAGGLTPARAQAARRRGAALAAGLAVGALFGGCASSSPNALPALPIVATPIQPATPAPLEPMLDYVSPAQDAVLVDRVPEGSFGP